MVHFEAGHKLMANTIGKAKWFIREVQYEEGGILDSSAFDSV